MDDIWLHEISGQAKPVSKFNGSNLIYISNQHKQSTVQFLKQLTHGSVIDGTALVYENNIVLAVFHA
jgi:hypothetical protein